MAEVDDAWPTIPAGYPRAKPMPGRCGPSPKNTQFWVCQYARHIRMVYNSYTLSMIAQFLVNIALQPRVPSLTIDLFWVECA